MTADARARGTVGVLARISLAIVLLGAVVGLPAADNRLTPRLGTALAVLAVGLVLGIGCLRHGARNEHERGRAFAAAAVVVALLALTLLASPFGGPIIGRVR